MVVELIARTLTDGADQILARDLFGTETPELISDLFLEHIDVSAGRPVARARFFEQSVGAVLGVELDDGTGLVVKAFGPETSSAHVLACCAAQAQLAETEGIAPRLVGQPRAAGRLTMVSMELREDGVFVDALTARYRRRMALTLVQLSERLGAQTLPLGIEGKRPPSGALYPRPHNALFDFAQSEGAEPIDKITRRARAVLDEGTPGDFVIGHTDWSARNMRFDEESAAITVVYDWDSLFHLEEAELAASAARGFGDDALAFLADYEEGRGRVFNASERRRVYAHLVYSAAYTARCEHALTGEGIEGDAARRLVEVADLL